MSVLVPFDYYLHFISVVIQSTQVLMCVCTRLSISQSKEVFINFLISRISQDQFRASAETAKTSVHVCAKQNRKIENETF